jgi:hypothetical protein
MKLRRTSGIGQRRRRRLGARVNFEPHGRHVSVNIEACELTSGLTGSYPGCCVIRANHVVRINRVCRRKATRPGSDARRPGQPVGGTDGSMRCLHAGPFITAIEAAHRSAANRSRRLARGICALPDAKTSLFRYSCRNHAHRRQESLKP